jgi:hypothetical protein
MIGLTYERTSQSMPELFENHGIGQANQKHLIVTFFGNPMLRSDGCHVRVLEMLSFLSSSKNFKVTFYSFRDYPVWPWSESHVAGFGKMFPTVNLVLEKWNRRNNVARRVKNLLCSLLPQFAKAIISFAIPGITPEWSKLRMQCQNQIYLVNYVDGLTQLNGINPDRAIVETHDLLFRGYAISNDRPVWCSSVVRRFRKEFALLNTTAMVVVIARNEHVLVELLLNGPEICYVPPHPMSVGNSDESITIEQDLLFLGSGNRKNIRAINAFLLEFRNWRTHPRLIIAGNVSDQIDPDLAQALGVEVAGYVENLPRLYGTVRAVICPVVGTGVNIKVMEALAYGKPVFAHEPVIAALPPDAETCVFPLDEPTVCSLLGDPSRLERVSQAARDYVDSSFIGQSWSDFREKITKLAKGS